MPQGLPTRPWSPERSAELYGVEGWGNGYFSVNPRGNIAVHPAGPGPASLDLKELVDEVGERGIGLPLLIRFSEIVKARLEEIHGAFSAAIDEYGYRGAYQGVYPIKVNQDRYLVERLLEHGGPLGHGLEAGSKPELLAAIALLGGGGGPIVCNGYKDREYVETALLASKLGLEVILVVEKRSELDLIREGAESTGVDPVLGVRARLASRGSGHWESSGGDRSKFGLSARGLVDTVEHLRASGLLGCFRLLHFHVGSQVSSIHSVKEALREAGRLYVNLVRMGAPMGTLDVGGGLGVDYDGSRTDSSSSVNYSLQEYANDVVFGALGVCDEAGIEHPRLISESGRATVAHHAVLVVDTLDVAEGRWPEVSEEVPEGAPPPLKNLIEGLGELDEASVWETYHDAVGFREECLSLFNLGHLTLEHRALADDAFLATCRRVLEIAERGDQVPKELEPLVERMADTYFCNFSLFQSLPDTWAIDQLFPVLPIHRLDEEPTRLGVLVDITCDSDGKIERFIDRRPGRRGSKSRLELHSPDGQDYRLGVFLVGAYQESLGDLHNLFGDTNTVHVSLDPAGGYRIDEVVEGDTVSDVLGYVRYDRRALIVCVRRAAEEALRRGAMSRGEARHLLRNFEEGLAGYTYLEGETDS